MPFINTSFEYGRLPRRLRTCGQRFLLSEKLSKTGYFEFDTSSKRMWFSEGMYTLLEAAPQDKKKPVFLQHFIDKKDWPLYKQYVRHLLTEGRIEGNIRIKTFKKNCKRIKFAASFPEDGYFPTITGIFADIGNELRDLEEQQSRLWAERAHDMRQPIQSMMMLAEELETARPEDYPETARLLKTIGKYLNDSLCRIIEDDKNTFKDKTENLTEFALEKLIGKIGAEYQEKARTKGLLFICKAQKFTLKQDAFLTERIIRNLLENALKYANSKIMLKNKQNTVFIADDGIGITKEDQKHIFKRFYQCAASSEKDSGYGLGLNIVAQLASQIDAKVQIKSRDGGGTVFKIRL